MSSTIICSEPFSEGQVGIHPKREQGITEADVQSILTLPETITKASSKQTYYTIKVFADRNRSRDAYRAYAYFRWVDDMLDQNLTSQSERTAFLNSQQALVDRCYRREWRCDLNPEERMLSDLIANDQEPCSGLQAYIRNMMAVMAFDAERRGRLISQGELAQYSNHLAIAVTEALHYFIGHDDDSPYTPTRYLAVTAAHITHLLRDTYEDVAAGYFNIPVEFLDAHKLDPYDLKSEGYRLWAKNRVQLARDYFRQGKSYIAHVKNLRRRIAGFAYTARFETVLNLIEKDDYQLRPEYPERKSLRGGLSMGRSLLSMLFMDLVGEIS